ncbi:MAG: prepilin peptidase [Bacillota bacterium]
MSEPVLPVLIIIILGLAVGSFLNVCIYRIPAGESIIAPRSHCPSCNSNLRPGDMIPVVSYMLLKGKCRYCGDAIHYRYTVVELLTAIFFVFLFFRFGMGITLLKYAFATSILLIVTFIDLDHLIIPNRVVLAGLAGAALFLPLTGEFTALNALYGILSASGFLLLLNLISRGGMGMGDVKLAAFMGLLLGWPMALLAVFYAGFLGAIAGIALIITRRKKRKDPIPFGPFLAAGTFISFMWGRDIISAYMNYILRP